MGYQDMDALWQQLPIFKLSLPDYGVLHRQGSFFSYLLHCPQGQQETARYPNEGGTAIGKIETLMSLVGILWIGPLIIEG